MPIWPAWRDGTGAFANSHAVEQFQLIDHAARMLAGYCRLPPNMDQIDRMLMEDYRVCPSPGGAG